MLSAARNEMLTRVWPGTPMGDLLRRYWMPVAGATGPTAKHHIQSGAALSARTIVRREVMGMCPSRVGGYAMTCYFSKTLVTDFDDAYKTNPCPRRAQDDGQLRQDHRFLSTSSPGYTDFCACRASGRELVNSVL